MAIPRTNKACKHCGLSGFETAWHFGGHQLNCKSNPNLENARKQKAARKKALNQRQSRFWPASKTKSSKRKSKPSMKEVEQFVLDFYEKHGDVMSRLANS